jgi:predicted ATPase/transcriptional regulator with XRE-family HTH domain
MERTSSFGYWLRRRRKALDLTQTELAQRVGCALGTIKKLETDQRRPSKQLAERLADLLQIATDERAAFLKAARAELVTDLLEIVRSPIATLLAPPAAEPAPAHRPSQAEQVAPPLPRIPLQYSDEHSDTPLSQAEGLLFVARQQELEWLDRMLDAALEKQHHVVFAVGEAGQGKTALMQAFARHAQQAHPQLIVAGGNCNAYSGMGDPYLPFREILELLTGDVEARTAAGTLSYNQADRLWHALRLTTQALLEVGRDLLDTFLPIRPLLDRVTTAAPGGAAWLTQLQALAADKAIRADTNIQQQTLFEQYARVIQDVARRVPLLLLLDDLQWADRGSIDLLFHLGRRLVGHRVLIVGAYRPTDVMLGWKGERHPLERVVNEFQRDWGDILLDLGQAEGRALVEGLIDSDPNRLDQAFRDTLYRQTGGHPLFTLELLRDMQERGDLVKDEQGRWIEQGKLDWKTVPAQVEGAISERISRLELPLQELLQVASVEGEEFTAELVAQALRIEEGEVIRRLSRDLDKTHRLVRAVGIKREGSLRLSRYRFGHILIQQYVYNRLDEAEQVYFHEALGQALERMLGDQAEQFAVQLARHFEAAQLPAKAGMYNEQAGNQAMHSAALDSAIRYYQAALKQWSVFDQAGRVGLLRKLSECQWVKGYLQDAFATAEACYALCETIGDREGMAAVQRLIGRMYWEQGDREQSMRHYHRALALLESGPESVELAWAISSISQMHMVASEHDQAISWGQRALAMAERLEAEHVIIHILITIGYSYVATGDAERGQAMLRRGWQRAVDLNLAYEACRAAVNLGSTLIELGLSAEARATFEELRTYAVRMQIPLWAGISLIWLARLDWLTGRWQSALARREEILAWIGQGQSIVWLEVVASNTFAWIHNDLGQAQIAREILEQAQPKVEGSAEIHTTEPYLGQRVRALAMLGLEVETAEAARQFLELIDQQVAFVHPTMPHLAVCRWFAGRGPDMRAELLTGLAHLGSAHELFGSLVTAAALSEGRGLVALSERDALRAVDYLQQAGAQWQALGRPYDQARALGDLGRAFMEAGDVVQAGSTFDLALRLIEILAAQLENPELKAAFLDSPLAQELRSN